MAWLVRSYLRAPDRRVHGRLAQPPLLRHDAEMLDQSMAPRRLLFVVTEDWFFRSHFLPMAEAAIRSGYKAHVACRCGEAREALEKAGCHVIPLKGSRTSFSPLAALREAAEIRRMLSDHAIDIAHFIAIRPLLVGFALTLAGQVGAAVFALTGQGLLASDSGLGSRVVRSLLRLMAPRVASRKVWFLFENREDPVFMGLDPQGSNISYLGGAGVDPDAWPEQSMPGGAALKIAFVGRMLRFKGVGDAVEALRLARRAGHDVELSLFGLPDPHNPASLSEAELVQLDSGEGVTWRRRVEDVREVWASHHVCIQPSHAGEGLPRALLEAASSGRPAIATDTPGCRELIRDGVEGLLVPPGRPDLLALAMGRMCANRQLVAKMGKSARRRILDGFTTEAVTSAVLLAYQKVFH